MNNKDFKPTDFEGFKAKPEKNIYSKTDEIKSEINYNCNAKGGDVRPARNSYRSW